MIAKTMSRLYKHSDDFMLQSSSTLHSLFVANLAVFTAFDSSLDAAFADNWQAEIEAGYTVFRDSQVKDVLAQKTQDVQGLMALCRLKYGEVKYFSTKAFASSSAQQAEFGKDSYLAARRNPSRMVVLLDEMHQICLKYTPELVAKGMSVGQISEILALRNNLMAASTEQTQFAKGRPVITQERLMVLNQCFQTLRTVISAAQIVYYNDFARRNQYIYSTIKYTKKTPPETTVSGTVANAETAEPVANASVSIATSLGSFLGKTNAEGSFFIIIKLKETEDCTINIRAQGFLPFEKTEPINPEDGAELSFALILN